MGITLNETDTQFNNGHTGSTVAYNEYPTSCQWEKQPFLPHTQIPLHNTCRGRCLSKKRNGDGCSKEENGQGRHGRGNVVFVKMPNGEIHSEDTKAEDLVR